MTPAPALPPGVDKQTVFRSVFAAYPDALVVVDAAGTIVDRIPPRLAVRRAAPLELPHIMILIDDPARAIIEGLAARTGEFAPAYGNRLAMFGNIDVMKMATNDLGLIEEEMRTKFAAGMATRGYAYHSDHSVPPQVSWDTYQAIIGFVERYGTY